MPESKFKKYIIIINVTLQKDLKQLKTHYHEHARRFDIRLAQTNYMYLKTWYQKGKVFHFQSYKKETDREDIKKIREDIIKHFNECCELTGVEKWK